MATDLGYTAQREAFRPNLYQIFSNDDHTDHGTLTLTEIRQVNMLAPWPKGSIEVIDGEYDPRPICKDCGQRMRYHHVERGDCKRGGIALGDHYAYYGERNDEVKLTLISTTANTDETTQRIVTGHERYSQETSVEICQNTPQIEIDIYYETLLRKPAHELRAILKTLDAGQALNEVQRTNKRYKHHLARAIITAQAGRQFQWIPCIVGFPGACSCRGRIPE